MKIQRPIKFRVWDFKNKCFQTRDASIRVILSLEYQGVIISDHKDFEFQQFTGLNDINGKGIFEGDIVEFNELNIGGDHGIGEVYWNDDLSLDTPGFGVWAHKALSDLPEGRSGQGYLPFSYGFKVIGNIFENKELLNNK